MMLQLNRPVRPLAGLETHREADAPLGSSGTIASFAWSGSRGFSNGGTRIFDGDLRGKGRIGSGWLERSLPPQPTKTLGVADG